LTFVERALPTNLVPNRDLGVMLHGNLGEGLFQYQLALMNGVTDGSSAVVDTGDGKDFVGRIFAHPFQNRSEGWLSGLGVGVSFNIGDQDTSAPLPVYRTAGQSTFFQYVAAVQTDDDRLRFSPQLSYYWGPFGLLGEYVSAKEGVTLPGPGEENFRNQAWQVAMSYVLTGENASYRGVVPRDSFSLEKGSFGAFEVAARYNELRVDPDAFHEGYANPLVSARRARAWGAGGNWYLNRWIKLMLSYEQTWFQGGGGGTPADVGDRDDEKVFFFRTQLAF
jgi:phosphate-selective porin OprO/OprP